MRSRAPFFGRDASAGVSRRLFALGLGPLDHVDMPAVDALKQQNRGEVCGRARAVAGRASCAPRNDDRSASSLAGHPCLDHWRSRVPARNREYRTPRVGRSHFGGGGSGSRSAVPTYPHRPHKWTTSPDSGRTSGSLRASLIASPHWGHGGAVSGSFRSSIGLGEHDGHCMQPVRRAFPPTPLDSLILQPHVPKS